MQTLTRINNDYDSFQRLISFYENNKSKIFENIEISLSGWFAANMCAALGGILELINTNLNDVRFVSMNHAVENILRKNNFLANFGQAQLNDNNNTTIHYQKLKPSDGMFFKQYIFEELLDRNELPIMSVAVKNKIAETIYEIFVNAQIHSETDYIFTCGQFFPNKHIIEFTITDIGIGFKNNINRAFSSCLSAEQALNWAVQDKHTVKKDTGGIGLAFLHDFIKLNNGKIQIVSHEGFYQFQDNLSETKTFIGEFPGTIVNLQFRTDDTSSYLLQEEIDVNNIF